MYSPSNVLLRCRIFVHVSAMKADYTDVAAHSVGYITDGYVAALRLRYGGNCSRRSRAGLKSSRRCAAGASLQKA